MNTKDRHLKKLLLELARDNQFTPFICNFCDRWCERCPKTQNCLYFANEQESKGFAFNENDNDSVNEVFWNAIDAFEDYRFIVLIQNSTDSEKSKPGVSHSVELAQEYANEIQAWINNNETLFKDGTDPILARINNTELTISDALEILSWYGPVIASKTQRSVAELDIRLDRNLDHEMNPFRDNIGSAKIAIIGCNRSMAVLSMFYKKFNRQKNEILAFLKHLSSLKNNILMIFPEAMQFVRPGFDEK